MQPHIIYYIYCVCVPSHKEMQRTFRVTNILNKEGKGMKEIYIICRLDADGMEHIMQSASTQEYALAALENLRNEAYEDGDYTRNHSIAHIQEVEVE